MYEFKLFAKKICSINFYNYLCSRKEIKEGWQSDRSRWTRNPVYPFRVSGV